MNKSINALKNIDENNGKIINFLFIVIVLVPSIMNIYTSIKINNIDYSEYIISQIIYFIKNIICIFFIINILSVEKIKKYIPIFYLPISSEEFFIFFNQQQIRKLIITVLVSVLSFIIATLSLKKDISILINLLIFMMVISILIYYFINIVYGKFFSLTIKFFNEKVVFCLAGILVMLITSVGSSKFLVISKYLVVFFEKYILEAGLNLYLVTLVICISLITIKLKKVSKNELNNVFNNAMIYNQKLQKVKKYKDINNIKFKTPLVAYIKNEMVLLKKGYFKIIGNICWIILIFSQVMLQSINIETSLKLDSTIITFINIYLISIVIDLLIFNYSINSIYFMGDFIELIKSSCLNSKTYYYSKLILKITINLIAYAVSVFAIYLIVVYLNEDTSNILTQAIICSLNVVIMTYFDNKLDFRYLLFQTDDKIKNNIKLKIKKYFVLTLSKISIILLQILINIYIIHNWCFSIVFSYVVMAIVIYGFEEIIEIHVPMNMKNRNYEYIDIDELIR